MHILSTIIIAIIIHVMFLLKTSLEADSERSNTLNSYKVINKLRVPPCTLRIYERTELNVLKMIQTVLHISMPQN